MSIIPTGKLPGTSKPTVTRASRFISSVDGISDWKPPTQSSGRVPMLQVRDNGTFPAFLIQTSVVPVWPNDREMVESSDASRAAIS